MHERPHILGTIWHVLVADVFNGQVHKLVVPIPQPPNEHR
jgi:hypothetical protein